VINQQAARTLVWDRLSRLHPIERDLARDCLHAGPGFCRWLEGSAKALAEAGLRREADRLFADGQRSIVLNDNVEQARATLESLLEQIDGDPAALGFRSEVEPAGATVEPDRKTARVAWPWLPAVAIAGVMVGLYGRAPLAALKAWSIARYRNGARAASEGLAWVLNALTPGPPIATPTWIGSAAWFLLLGLLVVATGLLGELLADAVRRDGPKGISRWRSARLLLLAVAVAAILTAVSRQ
jgi:hypothetical protein